MARYSSLVASGRERDERMLGGIIVCVCCAMRIVKLLCELDRCVVYKLHPDSPIPQELQMVSEPEVEP